MKSVFPNVTSAEKQLFWENKKKLLGMSLCEYFFTLDHSKTNALIFIWTKIINWMSEGEKGNWEFWTSSGFENAILMKVPLDRFKLVKMEYVVTYPYLGLAEINLENQKHIEIKFSQVKITKINEYFSCSREVISLIVIRMVIIERTEMT